MLLFSLLCFVATIESAQIFNFTSSGSWSSPSSGVVWVVVVGGGGGGGCHEAGGGGGGAVIVSDPFSVSAGQSFTVQVGHGGAAACYNSVTGSTGGNSSFIGANTSITALGGGGGASSGSAPHSSCAGVNGTSGGASQTALLAVNSPTACTFPGGYSCYNTWAAGGGGGASGHGLNATSNGNGGAGGPGVNVSINGRVYGFGGGGSGGSGSSVSVASVGYGGGSGGVSAGKGYDATNYTGGGGGGSGSGSAPCGGNGAFGIVIVVFTASGVQGDPSFVGFHGESFQVHGESGSVYSIITSDAVQFNAKFALIDERQHARDTHRASMATNYRHHRHDHRHHRHHRHDHRGRGRSVKTKRYSHPGNYMTEMSFKFRLAPPTLCAVGPSFSACSSSCVVCLLLRAGPHHRGFTSMLIISNGTVRSIAPGQEVERSISVSYDHDTSTSLPSPWKHSLRLLITVTSWSSVELSWPYFKVLLVNSDGFINVQSAERYEPPAPAIALLFRLCERTDF